MNRKTSLLIGAGLLTIAVFFLFYAAIHPEASFPWSNRITFMSYGVYIWLLLKFLVDISFLSNKRKAHSRSNLISAIGYFCMAIVFFLMEVTGDTVNLFTIIRGFIVVCAADFGFDGLLCWHKNKNS